MIRLLILCVTIVALAIAAPAAEQQFASAKFDSVDQQSTAVPVNLFQGTFFTRRDHTRPQTRDVFTFEYFANLDHYEYGGPFYIYLKDAGDYSTRWIEEGLMVDVARRTGGALFTFDHRYFGNNLVTENATFAEFEHLTVEQILSDIATFIQEMRVAHIGYYSRVIVWGSRYGATLGAWARKRYPHQIDAVWASSGIFEIESFTFSQYDLLQYTIYNWGGEQCRDTVQNAFNVLDYLIEAGNGDYIQERLNLCNPVDTESSSDIASLYEIHIQAIITYFERHHYQGVLNFCQDMNTYPGDALNSFARWKLHVFQQDAECVEHSYDVLVARSAVTSFEEPGLVSGRRQWYYLQCTQLGLFSISDQWTWLPNRVSIEYHLQKCADILGGAYEQILLPLSNSALRIEFGSLNQRITEIIYTNGIIDPWFYSGMIFTRDYNATVVNIDYHSLSADLTSISSADPIVLYQAKQIIERQLLQWSNYN